MKKSFTLVELLIAISIFAMISTFLYKIIDDFKLTDVFFGKQLSQKENLLKLKKILYLDYINSSKSKILKDKDFDIFLIESKNFYHNPFYNNISYFVTKKNNLIRCESGKKFDKNKINLEFMNNSYCNKMLSNVDRFKIQNYKKNKDKLVFLKQGEKKIYFRIYK